MVTQTVRMGMGEDIASDVIKVVPTEWELQPREPGQPTQCSIPGCGVSFKSWPQLALHQKNTHGIDNGLLATAVKKVRGKQYCYHCPVAGCIYDGNASRHFSTMKCLRQHYVLCHAEKQYRCEKCGRGFALECHMRHHWQACGKVFLCETCSCPYTTLEALRTHCLRKQHPLPLQYCKPPGGPEKQKTQRISTPKQNTDNGNLGPCFVVFQVVDRNSSSDADLPSSSSNSQLRPILPKATLAPSLPLLPRHPPPLRPCLPPRAEDGAGEATQAREAAVMWPAAGEPQPQSSKTCAATQVTMVTRQDVGLQQTTETSSTGMQTTVSLMPSRQHHLSSVGSQISVDDILQSAMQSADIPIERRENGAYISTESQTSWDQVVGVSPPRKRQCIRKRSKKSATQSSGNFHDGTREWVGTAEGESFFELMAHISTQTPALSSADAAVGSSEPMGSCMQSVESQTNLQSPANTLLLPGSGMLVQGVTSQTVQSCLRDSISSVDATMQTGEFSMQSQTQTHLSFLGSGTRTLVDAQLQTVPLAQQGVFSSQETTVMGVSRLKSSSPFLDADSFFTREFSSTDSSAQTSNLPLMADSNFFSAGVQTLDFPVSHTGHSLGQGSEGQLSLQMPTSPAPSGRAGSVLQDAATSPGAAGSDLQSSQTQTWLSAFSITRGSSPALGEMSSLRLDAGVRDRDLVLSPCFSMGTDMDDEDFMAEFLEQPSCSLSSRLPQSSLTKDSSTMSGHNVMLTSSSPSLAAEAGTQTSAMMNFAQTQTGQTTMVENDTQTLFSGRQAETQTDQSHQMENVLQSQTTQTAVVSNEAETQTIPGPQTPASSVDVPGRKSACIGTEQSWGLDWLEGIEVQTQTVAAGTDMHTQTASDLLDFLMSNMQTQTADNPFPSSMHLSNIQTQTGSGTDVGSDAVPVSEGEGCSPFLAVQKVSEAETQTQHPGTCSTSMETQTRKSNMAGVSMETQTTCDVGMATPTKNSCSSSNLVVSMETQTADNFYLDSDIFLSDMETQTQFGFDLGDLPMMDSHTQTTLRSFGSEDLASTSCQTQFDCPGLDLNGSRLIDSHTQTSLFASLSDGASSKDKDDAEISGFLRLVDASLDDSQSQTACTGSSKLGSENLGDTMQVDSHTQTASRSCDSQEPIAAAGSASPSQMGSVGDVSLTSSQTQTTLELPDFDDPNLTSSYTQTNLDSLELFWNMS